MMDRAARYITDWSVGTSPSIYLVPRVELVGGVDAYMSLLR